MSEASSCGLPGWPCWLGRACRRSPCSTFAMSFSSTVIVVKVLEERGESHALYGRVAIGILVMQDIIAVVFLTATRGHLPSPWALALVGLWPLTRVLREIWTRLGHVEMQSLLGIVMALDPRIRVVLRARAQG